MNPIGSYGHTVDGNTSTRSESQHPSVCFVAPKAYAALSGREDVSHIGGAERQQALLAQELARRGYRVRFVVRDHGQPEQEEICGIKLFKCYRTDAGILGLRFAHPRLTGLWRAMARANAQVYYQRGADSETGLVAEWCRRHRRGFFFAVAHDTNCMRVPLLTRRSDRWLFRYGIRRADVVIAQTFRQQRMLAETLGLDSTVIRSCCPSPADMDRPTDLSSADGAQDRILWVGRLSAVKRLEWVIRLATELPECHFDVVGQSNVQGRYERILEDGIRSTPNVRWHGYVPHAQMTPLYRQCVLLLCTSESEGFPNVFLEAWSHAKPVLTSVDPDDVIATFELGRVAREYLAMKEHVAALAGERPWWREAGLRGREYVRTHHSTAAAADALADEIERCVVRRATRTPS